MKRITTTRITVTANRQLEPIEIVPPGDATAISGWSVETSVNEGVMVGTLSVNVEAGLGTIHEEVVPNAITAKDGYRPLDMPLTNHSRLVGNFYADSATATYPYNLSLTLQFDCP